VQYGALKGNDEHRLKDLEQDEARLKERVSDQALAISLLKGGEAGNW
jgi:hypothetical protein